MTRFALDAKTWLLIAALAAAALLAGAHGFETFGRYEPCELCYRQRDVHWLALWFGALSFGVSFWRPGVARIACIVLGLIFLGSAALATYHSGVEWSWWPGPSSCTGSHFKGVSAADMASLLRGVETHVVACDAAAWRMFGISMAGYNALISAGLAMVSFVFAYRSFQHG